MYKVETSSYSVVKWLYTVVFLVCAVVSVLYAVLFPLGAVDKYLCLVQGTVNQL